MNTTNIPPLLIEPQRLSVKFSISRWDLLRCRLWVIAHNRILVLLMLTLSGGFPLLTAFSPGMATESLVFRIFYVVIVTTVMLCVMAVFQVVVQLLWVIANKNRGVTGMHEIEIRDDGLLERTSVNESLHRWSGFHKLGSTRNFLFVFVTDNIVHYVPLKAFPTKQDAKHFRDEIQRRADAV